MKRLRFEGWKGSMPDSYFNNLENGEWVRINVFTYIWLKLNNYHARIAWETE